MSREDERDEAVSQSPVRIDCTREAYLPRISKKKKSIRIYRKQMSKLSANERAHIASLQCVRYGGARKSDEIESDVLRAAVYRTQE